ncbi:MAG TPA: hypothetical protein VF618_02965 [Thermoanaerobaculia bacterium]
MRLRILVCVMMFAFAGATFGQQPAQSADDAARRAIDMLAGPAWDKARYLAFTFDVEREGKIVASYPQRYDRWTGDYRVAGKVQQDDVVVVMNVNTKEGRAWKNGTEVTETKDLLNFGYRRFINDTYWLLMPLKSLDPGVHREASERTGACGQTYDVVRLSFDQGIGLTPGDVYWMWVNRDTGLVDEWHMKLQNMKPEDEPSVVLFRDYRRIGGLLISTKREIKGRNQRILLNEVTVSETVPAGAFAQ